MNAIDKYLKHYLYLKLRFQISNFILKFIFFKCICFFTLIFIEKNSFLSPLIKNQIYNFLQLIILITVFFIIIKYLIHKFSILGNSSREALARELITKVKLKDRIINSIQIHTQINSKNLYSDLANRAISDTESDLDYNELENLFPKNNFKNLIIVFLSITILSIILVYNNNYQSAFKRLYYKNISYKRPYPFHLFFHETETSLYSGDDFDVKVNGNGNLPEKIKLNWKIEGKVFDKNIDLTNLNYNYKFKNVNKNMNLWAEHSTKFLIPFFNYKIITDTIKVNIKSRPKLTNLNILITPPYYTAIDEFKHQNSLSTISVLGKSIIKIEAEADKLIKSYSLKLNDKKIMNDDINKFHFDVSFKVDSATKLSIFFDDYQKSQSIPINYNIIKVMDQKPNIIIERPTESVKLDENYNIKITSKLSDDYGLKKVDLEYYLVKPYSLENDSSISKKTIMLFNNQLSEYIDYDWNLNNINISPGDEIRFWLKVYDNNELDGPGISQSKELKAYYPSLDELFMEVENEQNNIFETFDNVNDSIEELKNIYEELSNEVLKEEMGLEQQQSSDMISSELEEISNKIQNLENAIEQIEKINEKNNLINDTLGDKIENLQKMFKDMLTPELLNKIKSLQEAMENNDFEKSIEQLNEFEFEISDLENQIDRMMELFEQIMLEQKLDEIKKRVDKLIDNQLEISSEIQSDKNDNKVNSMEKNQIKEFNDLMKTIEEASILTENNNIKTSNSLKNLLNSNTTENIKSNMNQINQVTMNDKKKYSDEIENELYSLQNQLNSIIEEHNKNTKIKILTLYTRVIKNLIDLSHGQEKVNLISKTIKYKTHPQLNKIIIDENTILEQYKNLFVQITDLSNNSFYIKPEVSKSFGQTFKNITKSISNFEQGYIRDAKFNQLEILNHMNESIILLLNSMDEMQNSSSPSGYEQYLESLDELSKGQQSLNQGMQSALPLPLGQNGQNGLMQSLLSQQKQLMEKLQKLMDENGNQPGSGDGLGKAMNDMNDIINDLNNNILNEETYEKGENVYKKLLNHKKATKEKGMDELWKSEKFNNQNLKENKLNQKTNENNYEIQELFKNLNEINRNDKISTKDKNIIEEYIKILIDEKLEDEIK